MKTSNYIFIGALVILINPAVLSGQTTDSPHTEPPASQLDVGAPRLVSTSPFGPRTTSTEAASSAPSPPEKTTPPAATLLSPSEATRVSALSPEPGTVSDGRRDTTSLRPTAPLPTLPELPQNDSSLSPKPFLFTASTAVTTSAPPGKGITPSEPITTPATSTNQTDSDQFSTNTSPLVLATTQTIPQSTPFPPSTQTTHQPTSKSVAEKTTLKMTSLPLTPSPTQPLMSEASQTAAHLSTAPPKQDDPPQLDVGDEDGPHEGRHLASPLDPILAGLVSIFIVSTAIASVLLFLKFRHRHQQPEFHRLQDLPMDDLLEDTPLSRYTY